MTWLSLFSMCFLFRTHLSVIAIRTYMDGDVISPCAYCFGIKQDRHVGTDIFMQRVRTEVPDVTSFLLDRYTLILSEYYSYADFIT